MQVVAEAIALGERFGSVVRCARNLDRGESFTTLELRIKVLPRVQSRAGFPSEDRYRAGEWWALSRATLRGECAAGGARIKDGPYAERTLTEGTEVPRELRHNPYRSLYTTTRVTSQVKREPNRRLNQKESLYAERT